MIYRVVIVSEADRELRGIPAFHRRHVVDVMVRELTAQPQRESRSRVKRLRQPSSSVYRLRAGNYRVFYDVQGDVVTVLHVRHKDDCGELYGGAA